MEINRENLLELIRSGLATNKLSISALERQAGVAKDTIRDFLRGKTQVLRADKLQKVLRILKPEEKITVTGYVGTDAQIFPVLQDGSDKLDCPPGFSPLNTTALRVKSDAMLPVFHNGWIVYYNKKTESSPTGEMQEGWQVPYNKPTDGSAFSEFIDKPCVMKLADGRMYLRTLRRGSQADRYNLIGYNAAEIKDAELSWAAKIVFIKT